MPETTARWLARGYNALWLKIGLGIMAVMAYVAFYEWMQIHAR